MLDATLNALSPADVLRSPGATRAPEGFASYAMQNLDSPAEDSGAQQLFVPNLKYLDPARADHAQLILIALTTNWNSGARKSP